MKNGRIRRLAKHGRYCPLFGNAVIAMGKLQLLFYKRPAGVFGRAVVLVKPLFPIPGLQLTLAFVGRCRYD